MDAARPALLRGCLPPVSTGLHPRASGGRWHLATLSGWCDGRQGLDPILHRRPGRSRWAPEAGSRSARWQHPGRSYNGRRTLNSSLRSCFRGAGGPCTQAAAAPGGNQPSPWRTLTARAAPLLAASALGAGMARRQSAGRKWSAFSSSAPRAAAFGLPEAQALGQVSQTAKPLRQLYQAGLPTSVQPPAVRTSACPLHDALRRLKKMELCCLEGTATAARPPGISGTKIGFAETRRTCY